MTGPTYSNPDIVTYSNDGLNFATARTWGLKPPVRRNRGEVLDIHVRVTTLFTAVTTAALVNLGSATNATLYAQLPMGVAAALNAYNFRDVADANTIGTYITSNIDIDRDDVPIAITFTGALSAAATSGTLTASFTGPTAAYKVIFPSGESRIVSLTNSATTATWATGLSVGEPAAGATAQYRQVQCQIVAPTGGSPAGVGDLDIVIAWS